METEMERPGYSEADWKGKGPIGGRVMWQRVSASLAGRGK